MKSFLFLLTFAAFSASAFAQDALNKELRRSFKKYEIIKLDRKSVDAKARSGSKLKLRAYGRDFEFGLVPNDLRAANYRAIESNSNGDYELDPGEIKTFKGKLTNDTNSEVRFTVDERTFEGLIYTGNTKFFVSKARKFSKLAADDEMVFYAEDDLTESVDLSNDTPAKVQNQTELLQPGLGFAAFLDLRQLEVATEADYQWVQQVGGTAAAANTEILGILNMVDGIYRRDLSLTISVTFQHAWTSSDPFPTASMPALLNSLVSYWNSNYPNSQYPRDTTQLFTGKFSGQGLAYIGVICRSPSYAYGITARSGGANQLIAAHEIGHNLGADHVNSSGSCTNSMMNPSISASVEAFCDISKATISNFVATEGSCLTIVGPAPTPTPIPTPIPTPFPTATPVPTPFPTPIATPTPGSRTNYALASSGGTASASSASTPASSTIDGSRSFAVGGQWKDATADSFPDWLQVDFGATRTINQIDVYTVRDDWSNTADPSASTVFTIYGIRTFDVQYWNGSGWTTVPNGSLSNNNRVWTSFVFSPISTSRIRVLVSDALLGYSRLVEVEAWGGGTVTPTPTPTATPLPTPTVTPIPTPTVNPLPTPGGRTNVALASGGAVASASSQSSPPSVATDGARNWITSGQWKDATADNYPDWLQVDFNGAKTIDEIAVYGVRDDYTNADEPTATTPATIYGIVNFDVQYWNGSGWTTVPGGSVTGNTLTLRRMTFAPVTTSRIRVLVNGGQLGHSRIVEVEAWSGGGTPTPNPTPIPPTTRTNHARSSSGAVATGSTEFTSALSAIDGSRTFAIGGQWKDATADSFPDWLQVDFSGVRTIDEIDVYTVMDDFASTIDPSIDLTFSIYGINAFDVQYWNGSSWSTVPGGSIPYTNKVWTRLSFAPVATSRIRVVVNSAQLGHSRIVEVEAWGG